jgi:hypothetical protein
MREAAFAAPLSPRARQCLVRFEAAARLGSIAPDLPYFDRYAEEVVRYAVRLPSRPSPWGAQIHQGGAVALVHVVLEHARRERSELLAALALGLASHASIDRAVHPLVNALARKFPEGKTHDASHREVEKFQSILFHERYYGRDHMGSPGIVRLVAVAARELYETTLAGPALADGYARATSDADTNLPLRRMARGYELHARVLGSPLGKRVATPSDKERAAPLFDRGPWGTFDAVLHESIGRSVPVLEAAWSVFDASNADVASARAALDAALPAGSIEGQGHDVDLEAPYVVRPPTVVAV